MHMPNDAITINAICTELKSILINSQIVKIHQPEKDELLISAKNRKDFHNLVISVNPNSPRIHLTSTKKENPLQAPSFCMVLRKYLSNAYIIDIDLINFDRIVKITLKARNEIGDIQTLFVIVELMGRYSNIILTKEDFHIIDCLIKIPLAQNPMRPIFPNISYRYPPQSKIALDNIPELDCLFNTNEINEKLLSSNISGLSKDTIKEIIYRNNKDPQEVISLFVNINNTKQFNPCIRLNNNGGVIDFYFTKYLSQEGKYLFFDTINQSADFYYTQRDIQLRKKTHTAKLNKLLKNIRKKITKRIDIHTQKIIQSKDAEKYKQFGELVLTNIYKLKKGDTILNCQNFYTNENVNIPLDALKSPSQNAQSYFKKYTKLLRAKKISQEQLSKLNEQQEYLSTIENAIECSSTKQEYEEIYSELVELSGNKKQPKPNKKKKQIKKSLPHHIIIDSFDVYVGKNNIQNEYVTFELGSSSDLWLHAKNYHGAHSIIKGNDIPNEVIAKVAQITAYYSKGRHSGKVEVDYTPRKNVKRNRNGLKGMVIYTNYKTILVEPKQSQT